MSSPGAALEAALARAAAATEQAAGATRAVPLDPAVRAALVELSGPRAAVAQRSIGERVRRGLLDWDEVWREPEALGPDGVRLVQGAMVRVADEIRSSMPGPAS